MAGRDELDRYLGHMKPGVRLLTSVTVEGEIRFGLARIPSSKRKRRLTNALETVLEALHEVLPTTRGVASRYATLKADLWGAGTPIDENDLWIAAAALNHGLVLLTSDTDFVGIPQLAVEDWSLA